jgi:hypothetical protein
MTLVLVGGSERAGTTLLQSVLCSTPASNPPVAEDSTLRHLALGYEDSLRWFDRHSRFVFEDRDEAAAFFRDAMRRYLALARRRWPGTQHLVLKQPLLTPHVPALAELLPRARFVIVVRDPRAVIASLIRVAERQGRPQPGPRAMRGHVARFRSFYARPMAAFAGRHRDRVAWVRYEDLVTRPRETARRLGAFTGIDLSGYQSDAPWRGWDDGTVDLDERRTAPFFSPLWGGAVTDERVDAWREVLTEQEAGELCKALGPFMRRFGYAQQIATTTTNNEE